MREQDNKRMITVYYKLDLEAIIFINYDNVRNLCAQQQQAQ